MGIYIPNMKLPKGFDHLAIYSDGEVRLMEPDNCQTFTSYRVAKAVEAPPHGDLIDRMALLESIKEARKRQPEIEDVYTEDYFIVAEWLMSAPIVIPSDEEE